MSDRQPTVLALAPNGARKTKSDHPRLPMTAGELAEASADAVAAGASMIHVHVRDGDGRHTLDAATYLQAVEAIRERVGPGPVLQITTEAVGRYSPEEQMACIDAVRPEAVSIALRELVPDQDYERPARGFLARLAAELVSVQYILYDAADVTRFLGFRAKGIIPEPHRQVLFVLGRYAPGQRSRPEELMPFLDAKRGADLVWAICAFGPLEGGAGLTAAGLGGHVRLGFENNMQLADGSVAPDNAALIAQFAERLPIVGRRPATSDEARAILFS